MYRHLFYGGNSDDCAECADRVWRLDPSGPYSDFLSLVWIADDPAHRVGVRAHSLTEARELLKMRFGEESIISVWNEEAANQPRAIDFVSEPDLLATADQVVVISGAGYNTKDRSKNERLCEERSSAAINELAGVLTHFQPGEPMDWMEWPQMSVVFLKDRQMLAEFGLLSGASWVRTPAAFDRKVRDPERLRGWLSDRGVDVT